MNVVIVCNGPATAAERDVAARRQVPLLRALAARGVTTRIVLLGDRGGLRAQLQTAAIGVDVIPTPLAPAASSLARVPAVVARLRPLLKTGAPDIVEGDEPLPAIAVGLAVIGHRPPVVLYRRHHAAGRRRLLVASRLAARLSDRTVVSNQVMRREAAAADGVALDRIEIAASGAADLSVPAAAEVSAVRQRLGIPEGARVIGVVSRLRREKGLDVLIACLNDIEMMPLHVVVVGSGPEESSLRRLAAQSRVPVHFLGHEEDVAPWLALADVVALPSRRESFGRVTLEAMAAGRPIVASNVGGLVEAVIDGQTGLLVPPEDPRALAGALRRVLEDPSTARRMGEAARRRFEAAYTIEHMAAAWHGAWQRALAAQRHS